MDRNQSLVFVRSKLVRRSREAEINVQTFIGESCNDALDPLDLLPVYFLPLGWEARGTTLSTVSTKGAQFL